MSQELNIKATAATVIISVLLFGIVLAPFVLFDTVDETEYGLKYSRFNNRLISENVYEAGRHYTGIFGTFLIFPKIQQTIEFSNNEANAITGRTSDGLAIVLDMSFQYQLIKDQLVNLYREYGRSFEQVFIRTARDNIRDSASFYTAIEFFNNRSLIGTFMTEFIAQEFNENYYADVPALQLRAIDLPDTFEDALERAEVARQEIEIARLQQQAALIRAETAILEADAQRNITLIEANATAQAFLIQIEAQAQAVNITLTAEREAYYALSQSLNLTSAELLSFLWIQALQDIGEYGNLIIIGDNTPEIILDAPDNSTTTAY